MSCQGGQIKKKIGGTPRCKKDKIVENSTIFWYFLIYFKIWRNTWKNSTTHECVAAHRLRNTAIGADKNLIQLNNKKYPAPPPAEG